MRRVALALALGAAACGIKNDLVVDATAYAKGSGSTGTLRVNLVTAGEVMADVSLDLSKTTTARVSDVVMTSANVYAVLAFVDLNGDGKCEPETEDYWMFYYQYPASNSDLDWTVKRAQYRDTKGCSWFEGPAPPIGVDTGGGDTDGQVIGTP